MKSMTQRQLSTIRSGVERSRILALTVVWCMLHRRRRANRLNSQKENFSTAEEAANALIDAAEKIR